MNAHSPELPIAALSELCRRYQVCELALFGSAARGEQDEDSDLDFLVDFEPQARVGFLALSGLSRELSVLTQRPVDLVPKRGLKQTIRFFERCLGKVFIVEGFDENGQLELWTTSRGNHRRTFRGLDVHTIWIEPEYVIPFARQYRARPSTL